MQPLETETPSKETTDLYKAWGLRLTPQIPTSKDHEASSKGPLKGLGRA